MHEVIEELLGETFDSVRRTERYEGYMEALIFENNRKKVIFYLDQNNRQGGKIESIGGHFGHLTGSPLTTAKVSTNYERDLRWNEIFVRTFYTFSTVKGYVTVDWSSKGNGDLPLPVYMKVEYRERLKC